MIGVDFILRATTAGFTKAMATANNSVADLKKSIRTFDVGNGLKQALGVGGVIAGFRMAISYAQDLRKSLEDAGKSVPENVASVARYGDALKDAATGAKELAMNSLSFFTKAGEAWGNLINQVRGYSKEQVDAMAATEKAAIAQEERTAKAKKDMAEKGKKAQEDIAEQSRKNRLANMSADDRQGALAIERRDAIKKMKGMVPGSDAWKVQLAKVTDLEGQIDELGRQIQADVSQKMKAEDKKMADEENRKNEKARDELKKAEEQDREYKIEQDNIVRDKFAPSVEQLANIRIGTGIGGSDPRIIARKIMEKERFASEAGGRGDIKGAIALGSEAQRMRQGLENVTGKGTALTAETAESALRNALDQTNQELVEVKEAMKGIIKAQQ